MNISAGPLTWNQSMSDPRAATMAAQSQDTGAVLAGSFDAARCSRYYFEYGTTRSYGHRAGLSSMDCPNDGTTTRLAGFTLTNLQPGTGYHYRLVVVPRNGATLRAGDVRFMTTGGTRSRSAAPACSDWPPWPAAGCSSR